jgi:hypothetical protein
MIQSVTMTLIDVNKEFDLRIAFSESVLWEETRRALGMGVIAVD